LQAASRKAAEQVAAERAMRATAKGPTIVGRSFAEIETELHIAVRWQQAERAKAEAEFAATLAAADRTSTTKMWVNNNFGGDVNIGSAMMTS
jgi:hypothetical protein